MNLSSVEKISLSNHRILGARQIPSPHFNERPSGTVLDLIVVHAISLPPDQFGGGYIEDFFQGKLNPKIHPYFETISELKVSAHVLISRLGQMIQFVDFDKRAFHAGVSSFKGRPNCNDFSIGIELEGCDRLPFDSCQYHTLAKLILSLLATYPTLSPENIVGHSSIAPGRKTDPGPYFDWDTLWALLKQPQS